MFSRASDAREVGMLFAQDPADDAVRNRKQVDSLDMHEAREAGSIDPCVLPQKAKT